MSSVSKGMYQDLLRLEPVYKTAERSPHREILKCRVSLYEIHEPIEAGTLKAPFLPFRHPPQAVREGDLAHYAAYWIQPITILFYHLSDEDEGNVLVRLVAGDLDAHARIGTLRYGTSILFEYDPAAPRIEALWRETMRGKRQEQRLEKCLSTYHRTRVWVEVAL